jgi:Tfp pilus assembly protein PilF
VSVIINAMEAAKRERARRESQDVRPTVAPVLVPLRTMPATRSRPSRLLVLSIAGGVLIAGSAGAALVLQNQESAALPSVPPLTSTILSEALAADSVGRLAPRKTTPRFETANRFAAASVPPPATAVTTNPSSHPTPAPLETAAVAQGQAPVALIQSSTEPASAGRLRVRVERPSQPEAARLFAEAVVAHRAGNLIAARRLYESVLALTPSDGDALNNMGIVLSALREYSRAMELLRRAASIAPRDAGIWNNIGTVFHEQGKNSDAIAAFRHALTLDAGHAGAKVGLAQQYLAIGALTQARDLLDEVIFAQPLLPEALYTIGQVLERQGDRAGAIRAYETFVRTAPARLTTHVELVRRRIEALNSGR